MPSPHPFSGLSCLTNQSYRDDIPIIVKKRRYKARLVSSSLSGILERTWQCNVSHGTIKYKVPDGSLFEKLSRKTLFIDHLSVIFFIVPQSSSTAVERTLKIGLSQQTLNGQKNGSAVIC